MPDIQLGTLSLSSCRRFKHFYFHISLLADRARSRLFYSKRAIKITYLLTHIQREDKATTASIDLYDALFFVSSHSNIAMGGNKKIERRINLSMLSSYRCRVT